METPSFLQPVQNLSEQTKRNFFGEKKRWLSIIGLVILVLGIPLALLLLQRTQIFAPKAEVKPIELIGGADTCVISTETNKVSCASFPIKLTSPLGPPVGVGGVCMSDNDCQSGDICFNYQNYQGTCRPADTSCTAVITRACDPQNTNECVDFPTPCHVPPGWLPPGTSPSPVPSTPAAITACLKSKFNLGDPLTAANKNNTTILYWKSLVTLAQLKTAAAECGAQLLNPTNFTPSVLETLVRGAGANPNRNVLVEGPCSSAKVNDYTSGGIKVSTD
ncbi:MAG TPA: hypothetical protein VJG66_02445, partial [Patescibacteria group bacterium]|nr:hypothetical protein [Patescibacteria group bacterium]